MTPMTLASRFTTLAFTLILLSILFISVHSQDEEPGRCVPFNNYDPSAVLTGYNKPICQTLLEQAGITHYWVKESSLPLDADGAPREECYSEMSWWYDSDMSPIVALFEDTRPTPICQNAYFASFCFISFAPCTESPTTPGEYIKAPKKLCNWLCSMFRDIVEAYTRGESGELCTKDDMDFFYENGLRLGDLLAILPQFQCQTNPIFAPADTPNSECISPTFVKPDPVAPICEEYTGSFCAGVFSSGTRVFIPSGVIQSEMEQNLVKSAFTFNVVPQDSGCPEAALALLCQTTFQECLDIGIKGATADLVTGYEEPGAPTLPTNIAFGLRPPLEACSSYVEKCSATPYFSKISGLNGQPLMNCATIAAYNPSKCWLKLESGLRTLNQTPQNTYYFNGKSYFNRYDYEKFYFTVNAVPSQRVYWGSTFAAFEAYPEASSIPYIDCPSPTIVSPGTASTNIFNGRCALPCPTAAYSSADRKKITNAAWVFCILSLVFSGLLSLNFIIFKSQRHKRILFWYTLTYFGVAVMIFLGLVVTKNGSTWEKQCYSDTQYEHMTGFGLFQSIGLVYFFLASMCWWNMQSVDLYQRLIQGQQFPKGSTADRSRSRAMHLFCWTMPLICVIALIVGGQLGYDSYLPFAFITKDLNMTSNPIPLHYLFFLMPVLALAAIAYCLVAVVLIYLAKYDATGGLKKFQDSIEKSKSFWFKFSQTLKLFGFSLLMLLFIVLLLVHEISIADNQKEWDQALQTWGEELIAQATSPLEVQTPVLADRYAPGLIILIIFGFCSPGFFMFILYFICSAEVYGLWAGLFYYKLGFTFFKSIAREDTSTGGSDGSSGSNGSSTGKKTGTTVSGDLLTGGIDHTLTGRRVESRPEMNTGSDSHPTNITSSTRPPPPAKREPERKPNANLFKGFKSNKIPISSTNGSVNTSTQRDSGGLELAYVTSQSNLQAMLQDQDSTPSPVMVIVEEQQTQQQEQSHGHLQQDSSDDDY